MIIFVLATTPWYKKILHTKIVQGNAHKNAFSPVQTRKFGNCLMWFPWPKNAHFCFGDHLWHKKSMYVKIVQGNAHKTRFLADTTGKFRCCLMWFPRTKNDNFCFGDLLVAQKGHVCENCARHVCVTAFFAGHEMQKAWSAWYGSSEPKMIIFVLVTSF